MKKDSFQISRIAIISEIVGIIILVSLLFAMHPLVMTIGLPLGIFLIALGIVLWFVAIFRVEN